MDPDAGKSAPPGEEKNQVIWIGQLKNQDLKPDSINEGDFTNKEKGTQEDQGVEGKKGLSKPHAVHNIPESSGVTNPDQSNPKTNSDVEPTKSKRK